MKIGTVDLKNKRQWKAAIGLAKDQFFNLLKIFKKCYLEEYGKELSQRKVKTKIDYCIKTEDDLLFFTLFSLKSGLGYDALGLVCGMDGSNAKKNQKIGLAILAKTLVALGVSPKRKFLTVKDFEEFFAGDEKLILDATEQRMQRPCDLEEQKDFYSGKKKPIP